MTNDKASAFALGYGGTGKFQMNVKWQMPKPRTN